jgi:D-alanyl-D-alanine carboxypeptidase/D-alanyl-D-alanine-endopeptidase (penicillin-binding protein 4)
MNGWHRVRPWWTVALGSIITLAAPVPARGQETPASPAPVFSTSLRTPTDLGIRLDRILADPALARAHVGLVVQVAETGEVLYEHLGEKLFVPASNTKIVTAAVGLDALGADYRWRTTLAAVGSVRDGVLEGDVWIVGGGDPWLTRDEVDGWPAKLAEAGIGRIAPQWGRGWYWHEVFTWWGAGVSGLQLRPNSVRARLVPSSEVGDDARLELEEDGPPLTLEAGVRTGAPGSRVRLRYEPPPESGPVRLAGWIPLGDTVRLHLAPDHPTTDFLAHFERSLARGGIEVGGSVRRVGRGEMRPTSPGWSHTVVSDSLGAALAEMLKPSDNQMAESILRTIGLEATGEGSPEAGLAEVEKALNGWGIEPGAMALADGSGLSRYNRVAPNAMARLLRAMWRHRLHELYVDGMPVAAVDGTLRRRLSGTPGEENVRAKTGSLSSARALSGYLVDGSGETLVFSLMINDYDVPGEVAVAIEDLLIEQLALYRRPVEPGWPAYREDGS